MRRYYYADNVVMSITSVADVSQETNVSVQLLIGELPATVTGVEVPITFVKSQYNLLTRYATKIVRDGVYYVLTFNKADFDAEQRDTFLVQGQRCEIRLTATELNDFATMFYNHTLDDKLWIKKTDTQVPFYAVPESPVDLIVNFKPIEVPPVEGEKGPDNPSTIVQKTGVRAGVSNKNFIILTPGTTTKFGLTYQVLGNGRVIITGTNTHTDVVRFIMPVVSSSAEGKQYFLSGCPSGGQQQTYYIAARTRDGRVTVYDFGQGVVVPTATTDVVDCMITVFPNVTLNGAVFYPQLTLGTTKSAWETGVLTEYEMDFGEELPGGEYNFNTGLYKQLYGVYELTGTENPMHSTATTIRLLSSDGTVCFTGEGKEVHCSHFSNVQVNSGTVHFLYDEVTPLIGATTPEEFLAYAAAQYEAGTPITVSWKLDTVHCPVRTKQFTAQPVVSSAQSDKCVPVESVGHCLTPDATVSVVYAKSPIKEHEDITNAILSLGGTNV